MNPLRTLLSITFFTLLFTITTKSYGQAPLVANFVINPQPGFVGQPVTFVDQSTGNITNWVWDFGDGTQAYGPVAFKTYNTTGIYNATLTISNGTNFNFASRPVLIQVYIPPVPAIVSVGQGQTFTSLTGIGGLFDAINTNRLTANTTVNITSDLQEDGTVQLNDYGLNYYSLTIQPSAAQVRHIINSKDLSAALFNFRGIKNVTFDGAYNGAGRYLDIVNTHTDSTLCWPPFLIDGSSNTISIKNSIIETNSRGVKSGTIGLGYGTNYNILLENNQIRDAVSGAGKKGLQGYAITCNNNLNYNVTIKNNELVNFSNTGIGLYSIGNNWQIDGNHFYYNSPIKDTLSKIFIDYQAGTHPTIINNFMGGSGPNATGTWVNSGRVVAGFEVKFTMISMVLNPGALMPIKNNTIRGFQVTNTNGTAVFYGTTCGSNANLDISGNTFGDLANINSIVVSGASSQMLIFHTYVTNGSDHAQAKVTINNNTLANLVAMGQTGSGSVMGTYLNTACPVTVTNNTMKDLIAKSNRPISGSHPFFLGALMQGIVISSSNGAIIIDNNTIGNLKIQDKESGTELNAIAVDAINDSAKYIRRNRIYNLESQSDSGDVNAMKLMSSWTIENNQISITNGNNTGKVYVRGFYNWQVTTARYAYNSVYIGGATNRDAYSCAMCALNANPQIKKFNNNLLYNERTGPGDNHTAVRFATWGSTPIKQQWTPFISNHNFFVTKDTAIVNFWGSFPGFTKSMAAWRDTTGGDKNSTASLVALVPADSLFIDKAAGNLNIKTSSSMSWYINGTGMPDAGIAADFDSDNVRSTAVVNGATDIGADEFTTNTIPPVLTVYRNHVLGGADTLVQNGKIIAIIQWGNTGVLPVLGDARFYSGSWPNDTTNNNTIFNAQSMNCWWDIPATGGSNYSYSITLFYDSCMLGKVQDVTTMILQKKQRGADGTWQLLVPTQVNTGAGYLTATGLTSFSEFTATSANAPLAFYEGAICPAQPVTYTASIISGGYTYQWQVNTGAGFVPISDNGLYVGTTTATLKFAAPPTQYNRYQYRCLINTGTSIITDKIFVLKIVNTWNGSVSTDWNNILNWTCPIVPDAFTDVIIKAGVLQYPAINTTIICRSIALSPGAAINVTGSGHLQLTGK